MIVEELGEKISAIKSADPDKYVAGRGVKEMAVVDDGCEWWRNG